MTFQFREAKRENVALLLGLAGGTGSGKTWSALTLAKGLAGSSRFVVIDTENGRSKYYADTFSFDVADLAAPFRPENYAEAIQAADKAGYPVIVVDSMSHEWAGDGGLLDWHEEEYQRLGGRDNVKLTAWIKPKMAHRKFVTRLLQVNAHVILCFRAAERIEMVRNSEGKMEIIPKRSLTGADGWIPITEKALPFELTASFLLLASAPGVPKPIKLPGQFAPFLPLDQPISEEAGRLLGEWARGGKVNGNGARPQPEPEEEAVDGEEWPRPMGASTPETNGDTPKVVNARQVTLLWTTIRSRGVPEDDVRRIVVEVTGQESTKQIPAGLFDAVLSAVQAVEVAEDVTV